MYLTDRIVSEIIDLPCWATRWRGQFGLELSFGPPKLHIREPRASNSKRAMVRRILGHRRVTVRGAWWLWITMNRWKLTLADAPTVTPANSDRQIANSVQWLDGQKLTGFSISADSAYTQLHFDLGALLEIGQGAVKSDELWTLSRPSRPPRALCVRADGLFSHEAASKQNRWRLLSGA